MLNVIEIQLENGALCLHTVAALGLLTEPSTLPDDETNFNNLPRIREVQLVAIGSNGPAESVMVPWIRRHLQLARS